MTGEWRRGAVSVAYRLGEITLWRAVYPGVTCNRPFSEVVPDEFPALPTAGTDTRVCVVRSQPVSAALPKIGTVGEWIRYVPHQYKRFYVDLRGGFDGYLKRFSSKSRSTLQRKVRKFADASGGQIDWREYATPDELDEFIAAARELSLKTYQERLLGAGLPGGEEFRSRMREAAERAEVLGFLLFLGGRPVAYVLCPVHDGVLVYEYVGYDPEQQNLSPGTVLQYLILERLFGHGGFRMFDFTEGEGQQKQFFATNHVYCADLYFYRNTLRHRIAVTAHAALDRLSDTLVGLLDRWGLKAAIKRWIRKLA